MPEVRCDQELRNDPNVKAGQTFRYTNFIYTQRCGRNADFTGGTCTQGYVCIDYICHLKVDGNNSNTASDPPAVNLQQGQPRIPGDANWPAGGCGKSSTWAWARVVRVGRSGLWLIHVSIQWVLLWALMAASFFVMTMELARASRNGMGWGRRVSLLLDQSMVKKRLRSVSIASSPAWLGIRRWSASTPEQETLAVTEGISLYGALALGFRS